MTSAWAPVSVDDGRLAYQSAYQVVARSALTGLVTINMKAPHGCAGVACTKAVVTFPSLGRTIGSTPASRHHVQSNLHVSTPRPATPARTEQAEPVPPARPHIPHPTPQTTDLDVHRRRRETQLETAPLTSHPQDRPERSRARTSVRNASRSRTSAATQSTNNPTLGGQFGHLVDPHLPQGAPPGRTPVSETPPQRRPGGHRSTAQPRDAPTIAPSPAHQPERNPPGRAAATAPATIQDRQPPYLVEEQVRRSHRQLHTRHRPNPPVRPAKVGHGMGPLRGNAPGHRGTAAVDATRSSQRLRSIHHRRRTQR